MPKPHDSSEGLKGRCSGRLKLFKTKKQDFSTSFTKKVQSNNESLAKSLAKARALIERQADEIKLHKASYNEVVMKNYALEVDYKEKVGKLDAYITRSLHEVRSVLDTIISMKDEISRSNVELVGKNFRSDVQQQRVLGLAQTQSVRPMVQGHSIKQPRISLLRIDPPNGASVPPAPLPAVPSTTTAAAATTFQVGASIGADPATIYSGDAAVATASSSPRETRDMFYKRARNEDPGEGPSSGRARPRLYKHQPVFYPDSSSEDDEPDDEPDDHRLDWTTLSPVNMDETLANTRLSTIIQEVSPDGAAHARRSSVHIIAQVAEKVEQMMQPPHDGRGSPAEGDFRGFSDEAPGSLDRSAEELKLLPWSRLDGLKSEPSHVETFPTRPASPVAVPAEVAASTETQSERQAARTARPPMATRSEPAAPGGPCRRAESLDDEGIGGRGKRRKRRAAAAMEEGAYAEIDSPVLASSHRPRVLVKKLDAAAIAAVTAQGSKRSMPISTDVEEKPLERLTRRAAASTINYKEPRLDVKLRRN